MAKRHNNLIDDLKFNTLVADYPLTDEDSDFIAQLIARWIVDRLNDERFRKCYIKGREVQNITGEQLLK